MKLTKFALAGALFLGMTAVSTLQAQGPLYDRVLVNLPYSVTIGERTLTPGDYVIRQLPGAGGGSERVLLIYSDNGMKFETSAMTIPALDNQTPDDTKVMLHHIGNDYYFDKIWIQGKNYGYEFVLPDAVKSRQQERSEPMTVAARYEAAPAEETTTAAQSTAAAETRETQSQTQTTPPDTNVNNQNADNNANAQTAQAQPEPAPAPAAEPAPAPAAANTADRQDTQDTMPDTAANWMALLLGGAMLTGTGLALRRK